jgi:magnesium-transporting ATPase (P-type)
MGGKKRSYRAQPNEEWHTFSGDKIADYWKVSEQGLSKDEHKQRLALYGPNELPHSGAPGLFKVVVQQFIHPLIAILAAAAVLSLAVGEAADAMFIVLVIVLNSALGAWQEYSAGKRAEGLRSLLEIKTRVYREGVWDTVEASSLVPGDIVSLASGMKVPADLYVQEAFQVQTDESFLTGESMPAQKGENILAKDVALADRSNMLYAGGTIVTGRAVGWVVATGLDTQVGRIAGHVNESVTAKPPLVQRMERFIRHLTLVIVALSLFLALGMRIQGAEWSGIFLFVVALAVAAIPEGLPVGMTVALSLATRRMAARNVIVRKLTSVESLGSCTVIASDKTGTLTLNEQTVASWIPPSGEPVFFSGKGYHGRGAPTTPSGDALPPNGVSEVFMRVAVLSNEADLKPIDSKEGEWTYAGDAMDVALLAMVWKTGTDPYSLRFSHPLLEVLPYESEQKFSAALWAESGGGYAGMKGAPETVLSRCFLSEAEKEGWINKAVELAGRGYRVLAFAGKAWEGEKPELAKTIEGGLTFLGYAAFIDPLRPGATDAVAECKRAGIKVIMITGDHPNTAAYLAGKLGLIETEGRVLSGDRLQELAAEGDAAFCEAVNACHVFARVSPTQKLAITDALIRSGEFVAVTGDGVNDAPALKRANIGVAMGSGTDVARETANMIVTDDDFASIVAGIALGRQAYDNVRKVILFLISNGFGLVLTCVLALPLGLGLPFLPVQLLWLNLVTNGIQDVALAFEAGEPGNMLRPPRKPNEGVFNRSMIRQTVLSGTVMGLLGLGLWYFLTDILLMSEGEARTWLVLLVVFMQNIQVLNSRSEIRSVFQVSVGANPLLMGGVVLAQLVHFFAMHLPFMQALLHLEPISFSAWFVVLLIALPVLLVMEVYKFRLRSRM